MLLPPGKRLALAQRHATPARPTRPTPPPGRERRPPPRRRPNCMCPCVKNYDIITHAGSAARLAPLCVAPASLLGPGRGLAAHTGRCAPRCGPGAGNGAPHGRQGGEQDGPATLPSTFFPLPPTPLPPAPPLKVSAPSALLLFSSSPSRVRDRRLLLCAQTLLQRERRCCARADGKKTRGA